jgi:hypothetical protein
MFPAKPKHNSYIDNVLEMMILFQIKRKILFTKFYEFALEDIFI